MRVCPAGCITLNADETGSGLSQRFVSRDGRTLCIGDPSGDILLSTRPPGRSPPASCAYTSASPSGMTVERDDLLVETAHAPAPDAQGFDVTTRLTARRPLRLVALGNSYLLPCAPEFAWSPALKSAPRDLVGDHVFRSPCLIARSGDLQVALVPRLDDTLGTGPLRATLDFSRGGAEGGARMSMALRDYEAYGHVYYRPTGKAVQLAAGESVELSFTLLFDTNARHDSAGSVLRFLWRRYGERSFASIPSPLPADSQARLWFESTLERYRLWRGFTLDGKECGGICARIVRPALNRGAPPLPKDTTLAVVASYLLPRTLTLREKAALVSSGLRGIHPHLCNAVFFNNVRSSFGMAYYGRLWGDAALQGRAHAIWNLALAAPAPAGVFPAVFSGDGSHPRWVPGTKVWRYTRAYHVPNAAVTGWWMLAVDRYLEPSSPFRERCLRLGDFLLRAQLASGAIPTWVHLRGDGSLRPLPALAESAGSAAPGLFLALLAASSGRSDYGEAARRVADFIIARAFPTQEWFDTEVFYSCSEKPLGWRDPWTGIPPQGTLCVSWAAGLFGELYRASRESRYLEYGRAALDLLLLSQQIWDVPFMGIDTRGGFGVMNTDAEWNDARQAELGLLLLEWHELTGEEELRSRGMAALHASFTLMQREGEERGAVSENYGHVGRDVPIQGYVMPDWGGGTAVAAAALATLRWASPERRIGGTT